VGENSKHGVTVKSDVEKVYIAHRAQGADKIAREEVSLIN